MSRSRAEEMRQQTIAFHRQHPEVWELFCAYTVERIGQGFTNYSADAIMHRVRWHTATPDSDNSFKINNNFVTYYARAFMRLYPDAVGFFRLRKQLSDARPATGLDPLPPPPDADPNLELDERDEWPRERKA